jgi:hypothetical protein
MTPRNSLKAQQMQYPPQWPTQPFLTVSHLVPQHPAIALHAGWVAARAGAALDVTQGAAWIAGWKFWHRHQPPLESRVAGCVTQLRSALQMRSALQNKQP